MPASKHGRLIAACLLAVCGIAGSAAVIVGVKGQTPPVAESPAPPAKIGSLPVPPRPVPPAPFRSFTATELGEMVEVTDDGLRLPRISASGWMPWIAYARRFDQAASAARVGILVINLGADEGLTRRAINELPSLVSLAFLPGSPDLPRWLREARERGHEAYLMLPVEEPGGLAERGLRPIQASLDPTENLARLRSAMARGEGYAGFVMASASPAWQSQSTLRPLLKEIGDRGLGLVEINPAADTSTVQRLTEELGIGYARTGDVLDYKLADGGLMANLERLDSWVSEKVPEQPPRHRFGVVQPDGESIDAIAAWIRGRPKQPAAAFVPIIGHFECRDACMARLRVQPAQLRP